ncbi:MAG: Ig-like domain-containing protein [Synergistaceae bacterium]|nr:Ig-like domain-containing protein [Synergistaceae bacterium]
MRVQKFFLFALLAALLAAVPVYGAATAPKGNVAGVQSFAPTGRVSDNVSFRLVFRNPMVPKGKTGKAVDVEDFPFTVEPAIQAEGRWQNDRTFTAKLLAPLKMATEYTATMKSGLKDLRGGRVAQTEYHFQTDAFSPTDVRAVMDKNGRARFTLTFNTRTDPNRLKGFLKVLDEKGQTLNYSINGALPGKSVTLSVPVEKSSSRRRFTVAIAKGMTGSEGDLGLKEDFSASVVLDPVLMVESLRANDGSIQAYFNFDVDPDSIRDFIRVEPETDFSVSSGWMNNMVFLRGEAFKPRSRFTVSFRKGLPAKGGLVLKENFTQAVIMPDLESEISLPASGSYLTALGKGLIPLELVNVKKVQVDLWRLYENNIPYVIRGDYNSFQKDLARRVYSKEFDLSLPLNERVRRSLAVEDMAKDERGLFLLSIRDTGKSWWDEESQILNLSDLGAVARVWEDGILLWVNTLTGTEPVRDAEVRVYSDANQVIAEGRTDGDGVFLYERGAAWETGNTPRLAVVSKGKDLTYVQLTRSLLSRETFDTAGRPWLRDGYDAIVFSPRDIYRTGEQASFKAVVRNTDITTPKDAFPVLFIARDPLGRKARQETVVLNEQGSALFDLPLPANALTGRWTVSLAIPGKEDSLLASMGFHVEDFAPPRIEVKVETDAETLTHEDKFAVSVAARWLFGVDGANLPYRATWSAKAANFVPKKDRWKGYSFGDPSRKFAGADGEFEEKTLDASGRVNLSLTLNADWQAASIIDMTMRAEVMEDGGRWVSGSVTRPYFPAPWLLGIAPTDGKMSVRKDLKFSVAAIGPDEEPADPGELTATVYHVRWNYNMVEIDGYRRWQSTEELLKVAEESVTLKNGLGSVSFRPEEWGTYLIRVADEKDEARATYRFFADDPQYAGVGSSLLDRVEVTLDKEFYKVGETARVTLRVPFEGLLLLGVEGAKLSSRSTHKVDKAELTLDVPVTKDLVPNGWITAWLIRPVREDDAEAWGGHRAVGLTRIKTDLSEYTLDVAMDTGLNDKKAEPASTLPVSLELKDSDGKPVKDADVALALVDDAVLGLTGYKTPDLLNHFWGLKELGSEGYDLYDQIIPVESRATEPLHPAGGAAMAALAGDGNVQRFKILSLFQGHLTAGSDGVVKAELSLPEFSGRGRLFAVVASGNRFGLSEQRLEIARSVVTEANLPRFAAPGDTFVAPFTVFNTSDEDKDIKITISVPNGGLKPEESETTLTVAAGGSARWSTNVRALEAESAKWVVTTAWEEDGESKEFVQEIDLPIRSPWPVVARSGSGTFEAGNTEIDVPLGDFSGKAAGTLTLADTPAADLTRAVAMLLSYPYGCLEQTISAAWPFLVLPDAIANVDPLLVNSAVVKVKTEAAIARVQAMQLYDGSFAMWPGNGTPYNWGSVYAAHFLIEARNAGVAYPEEMLGGVMSWLRQFMASMPSYQYPTEERDDFTAKAYGAYVLTLYGEKPLGWIEYLRENQDSMWPSGRIWLAGAQALIDGRADALRELNLGSGKISAEARWRTLESDVRNTAQLLSLWLEVEPQAEEALELAARLVKRGQEGQWFSTQDNATALMALARYNLAVGGEKADLKGALSGNGKEILSYQSGTAASTALSSGGPASFQLNLEGKGKGYYAWNLTGTPRTQPRAERRGLNVECVWLDEKGNEIDLSNPVSQGTRMQVILTLKPSATVNSLAVSCLLPAGLELENPRLDETAAVTPGSYGVVSDVRDDRLLLFFDRLSGETTYGFKVRAVTRGTFAVPPISAMGMYDPAVRFTGRSQPELVIE